MVSMEGGARVRGLSEKAKGPFERKTGTAMKRWWFKPQKGLPEESTPAAVGFHQPLSAESLLAASHRKKSCLLASGSTRPSPRHSSNNSTSNRFVATPPMYSNYRPVRAITMLPRWHARPRLGAGGMQPEVAPVLPAPRWCRSGRPGCAG